MAGKPGMPFTAAFHPRGFGGLFTPKPTGLKVPKKRPSKMTAHLASPSKRSKIVMKKKGKKSTIIHGGKGV